ncbi:phosphoesterase, partial [Chytriomyces sp. MP71]
IKHVVVLVQENRSFDNLAGYYNYTSDIDNLIQYSIKNKGPHCNPKDVTKPNANLVCAYVDSPDVQPIDPDHSLPGTMFGQFGQYYVDSAQQPDVPPMNGFVQQNGGSETIIASLPNSDTQHTLALASNFVLFDRWFSSAPAPTNPNRAFITSGTTAGHGSNDLAFFLSGLKQKSIFQVLSENKITWKNYNHASGFKPDALFYSWVNSNAAGNVVNFNQFFTDAAAGALPQFSYINPECCAIESYHPSSPVSKGEAFVASIVNSLLASPNWNETLFILTFDEAGGFADHVPSPRATPPGDNKPYSWSSNGHSGSFKFDRFGVRVPTYLASPYLPKGHVEHAPASGEYDHTSIAKFLSGLWGLPDMILTDRVRAAPDFAHLFLNAPRRDTPSKI